MVDIGFTTEIIALLYTFATQARGTCRGAAVASLIHGLCTVFAWNNT